jgi:hypothetical protein
MMRGQIINRGRSQQIVDYSGLCWGKITPTDIDGVLDFGGQVQVIIELKHADSKMKFGQRLALERLSRSHPRCLVLVVEHHVDDVAQDIDATDCAVREYYSGGHAAEHPIWREPKPPIGARAMIDKYLARFGYTPAQPLFPQTTEVLTP